MGNDVLFELISLLIISPTLLYLIITQKRNFEQLHTRLEELSNNLQELTGLTKSSCEEKYDKKDHIKKYNDKELDRGKIKALETTDFDFQIKAHDKGKHKNKFIKGITNNEEMDFGEKYLFNHFSNSLTERNKKVERVRKLK